MSTERTTLSAQVDSDTELAKQFDEYQEQNAMTSRSEAVRHLVRAGLEQELSKQADEDAVDSTASGAADEQPAQLSTDGGQQVTVDVSLKNAALLSGLAFVYGSDGLLTALQSVAGRGWGTILFSAVGLSIVGMAVVVVARALVALADRFRNDADANASGVQA